MVFSDDKVTIGRLRYDFRVARAELQSSFSITGVWVVLKGGWGETGKGPYGTASDEPPDQSTSGIVLANGLWRSWLPGGTTESLCNEWVI